MAAKPSAAAKPVVEEGRNCWRIARANRVSVVVDAAAEYDWPGMIKAGATAVILSAQKAPAGTTAGVIAGKRDFIRACYVHGERA